MDKGLGAPLDYVHETCGHAFHPVMVCSECSEPLSPKQVNVKVGKGLYAYHSQTKTV